MKGAVQLPAYGSNSGMPLSGSSNLDTILWQSHSVRRGQPDGKAQPPPPGVRETALRVRQSLQQLRVPSPSTTRTNFAEKLNWMLRPDGSISRAEVIGWAVFVTPPADTLGTLRMDREVRHSIESCVVVAVLGRETGYFGKWPRWKSPGGEYERWRSLSSFLASLFFHPRGRCERGPPNVFFFFKPAAVSAAVQFTRRYSR